MNRLELQKALDKFDKKRIWAFSIHLLKLYFPHDKTIAVSLNRHIEAKIIDKATRGIYINPRATSRPKYPLEALASIIRPAEQFYLSLETLLSEVGYISQMPNRLTFMTTGRSQTFNTPYGILELVHSSRSQKDFLKDCTFNEDRNIWIASSQKALRDSNRTRRSIDLIDKGAFNGTI